MEKVIWFNMQCDALSQKEFNVFSTKLFNTFNKRSLLIQSLCQLLLNQCKKNESRYIISINQILSDIICSRHKNTDHQKKMPITTDNKKICINDLPSPLISHCASFLKLGEVMNFENCNRYLFYSCNNNSTTISSLITKNVDADSAKHQFSLWHKYLNNHGDDNKKYQLQKLKQFKMIQNVLIKVDDFDPMQNPSFFVWNNLNKLAIPLIEIETDHLMSFINSYGPIISNINLQWFDIGIMTKLARQNMGYLAYSDEDTSSKTLANILQILTINKQIHFLSISRMDLFSMPSNCNFNVISKLNLKGVMMKNMGNNKVYDGIMRHLNFSQIESIHLELNTIGFLNDKNEKYVTHKLKELCFDFRASSIIKYIKQIPKCQQLQRIKICYDHHGVDEMYHQIFSAILTTLPHLEYLFIPNNSQNILMILIKILDEQCKKNKTSILENFKLEFGGSWSFGFCNEFQKIEDYIFELIDKLNSYVSNDWMLILPAPYSEKREIDKEMDEDIFGEWFGEYNNYNLELYRNKLDAVKHKWHINHLNGRNTSVISNKNNKMCGYKQQWIMSCECESAPHYV